MHEVVGHTTHTTFASWLAHSPARTSEELGNKNSHTVPHDVKYDDVEKVTLIMTQILALSLTIMPNTKCKLQLSLNQFLTFSHS